jgi:hypothetical protein
MNNHKAGATQVKAEERRRLVRAAKYALVRGPLTPPARVL